MSLTDFLEQPDVRAKFKEKFPKPKFELRQEILATSPLGSEFRFVGIAYDYLLRFYVKYLNPHAQERGWVAGNALRYFQTNGTSDLYERAQTLIEQAYQNYQQFLKNGQFTNELLQSSLVLARLDAVKRAGYIHENWQVINEVDAQDLRNLVGLLKPELFKSSGKITLNPSWPEASFLVGGADGDLIFDNDLLIDFKTVKKLSLERRDLNQLIGYYTLAEIDRRLYSDAIELKRLGIYFSRFGVLYQFNVEEIVNPETFPKFLEWFIVRAEEYSGRTII